jgi:nucleotide-binding universal stress UspA family protein
MVARVNRPGPAGALGSVALAMVRRAGCPVAVIPA